MIIQAGDEKYFMILRKICQESEFIAATGVRLGSPGAELASRIYCCLFNDVTDIPMEYEKYYNVEYGNIWQFLYWHYSIDTEVIEQVRKAYKPSMHLLYGNIYSGGDYAIGYYIMCEEGFPILERVINAFKEENLK